MPNVVWRKGQPIFWEEPTRKSKESHNLKKYKEDSIKTAKQLLYSGETLHKIRVANSEIQVDMIMLEAAKNIRY